MNPLKNKPRSANFSPAPQKPAWMKVKIKFSRENEVKGVRDLLQKGRLHTVCESASCPNLHHCWSRKTATFMIGGDICPKRCSYCDVAFGKPSLLDEMEPANIGKTVAMLGLKMAVITSVNRDDLADCGAGHFAKTISEIKNRLPSCKTEVLIPDLKALDKNLQILFAAKPDIINHNIETVERLTKIITPGKNYSTSLLTLQKSAAAGFRTKSGIILGMGETLDEVMQTLGPLRENGVTIVTIGQYLQPTPHHHKLHEYITPEVFSLLEKESRQMGFTHVSSGPLVRSSYHADEISDI